jgi:hypothetical protein
MPAALPVKQQCFGDPVSTAQGVKLGNPWNMPEAAANGRDAQCAAADQFAANALPMIESLKAAGATSFDAIAKALNARGIRTAARRVLALHNRSEPPCPRSAWPQANGNRVCSRFADQRKAVLARMGESRHKILETTGLGTLADMNFADFIARERERLRGERDQIFNRQQELETKLAAINRELSAIDAYEAVKSGKAPAPAARQARTGTGRTTVRRGSRREGLLALIRDSAGGLSRGVFSNAWA